MTPLLWVLVGVIGLLLLAVGFLVYRFAQLESHLRDRGQHQTLVTQLGQLSERLDRGLSQQFSMLQNQGNQAQNNIREITTQLTELKATNQQVKEYSSQLQSLENILRNPKHRGILGEYFLDTLLGQVFQPNQYQMQYKFTNGEIVDAVIFYLDQVIPIDAKFSLEKYNQLVQEQDAVRRDQLEKEFKNDIKNRIDETAKYIRPEEKTTNFALMYIPAEGIYYNLLISKVGTLDVNSIHLLEYAAKKKVTIVSPVTMIAVLQTVIQGLKANQIEKSVQEILERVHTLGRHVNAYEDYLKKLGSNLGTTINTYNAAYKEFGKIDKDVYKLTGGVAGGTAEVLQIDKPTTDES